MLNEGWKGRVVTCERAKRASLKRLAPVSLFIAPSDLLFHERSRIHAQRSLKYPNEMARVQILEAKLCESSWFWCLAKDVLLQGYQIFLPLQKTPTFQIPFDLNYYLFIYYLSIIIMVATSTYVSLLLRNDVRSDKKEIRVTTFKHVYNFFYWFYQDIKTGA